MEAEAAISLISPNDHWVIWTSIIVLAALSIFLEQKTLIAEKLTGPVLALVFGMAMSNLGILPIKAAAYDIIWEYIVPLAIPLLLMQINLRQIIKEAGRMFGAFHISALGTIVGVFFAVLLLYSFINEAAKVAGVMTASYIGGGVNFLAMVSTFKPTQNTINATIVADNVVMALYFILLITLPTSRLVRRIFPKTDVSRGFHGETGSEGAKSFWKAKPISLLDISLAIALAFVISTLSVKVSNYFSREDMPRIISAILGQRYLVLTTFSIALPSVFPKFVREISGSNELGTFFIYLFFVLLGIPASLKIVILNSPLLLVFCMVILLINFIITFGLGKLFGFELEECILVAAATSGGPMSAAAIAIAKGWEKLVVPSFLVGIWGYVIGNYVGYCAGVLLIYLFGR